MLTNKSAPMFENIKKIAKNLLNFSFSKKEGKYILDL